MSYGGIIMVSLRWCREQMRGIILVEPSRVMAESYLLMAEETLAVVESVASSRVWTAVSVYYVFYYSLYAYMLRMGISCEIHSCSLEFMRRCLVPPYDAADVKMIGEAFSNRIDLQYYLKKGVSAESVEETKRCCRLFYAKTKAALSIITDEDIASVRKRLDRLS